MPGTSAVRSSIAKDRARSPNRLSVAVSSNPGRRRLGTLLERDGPACSFFETRLYESSRPRRHSDDHRSCDPIPGVTPDRELIDDEHENDRCGDPSRLGST